MTIWAISGALALAGLVLLTVAAVRLLARVRALRDGVERVKGRAEEAAELRERLDATMAEVLRVTSRSPRE